MGRPRRRPLQVNLRFLQLYLSHKINSAICGPQVQSHFVQFSERSTSTLQIGCHFERMLAPEDFALRAFQLLPHSSIFLFLMDINSSLFRMFLTVTSFFSQRVFSYFLSCGTLQLSAMTQHIFVERNNFAFSPLSSCSRRRCGGAYGDLRSEMI